jgi:hypothetical protein
MATNASGREYQIVVGIQDVSALAIGGDGSLADADFVSGSRLFMRVAQVSGINYDDAFQTATVLRSGRRAYEDGDFIRHYGSGSWTWDFDYLVESEVMLQSLLTLVTGVATTTGAITISSAVHDAHEDLSHGSTTTDNVGIVMLLAPPATSGLADDDHIMHSAVLQNLTLAMDMDTDGGRLHASGQFMSGYKPIVKDAAVTGATTASDYEKGLYDFTVRTVGGHTTVTVKSFTMTISNPAQRVGWQGTSGEADGYVRGGLYDISGSITLKYDDNTADALQDWQVNPSVGYAIALNDGANWDISIPSARMTGHNIDFADEGMFVEIPWTATTGIAAAGNLAVITMS